MKFASVFTVLAASISFVSVLAGPAYPLVARSPAPLPSHLGHTTLFYRAVYGPELQVIASRYPETGHPTGHKQDAGDFASHGGLYVFADIEMAKAWGSSRAKILPQKYWYLVTFQYTPNSHVSKKTFPSGDQTWKAFVNKCYDGKGEHFDIVEGPISVGSGPAQRPYVDPEGKMVWQGAFIGKSGLGTLTVKSVQKFDEHAGDSRRCCTGCNIM